MSSKPTIEVCFSPEQLHLFDINDKIVVVVDILRATTTIAWALHNGVSSVTPVMSVEEALSFDNGRIKAAERKGQKVEGFDYGNSPFDYENDDVKGKELILTTTNGTKALKMAEGADGVVCGAFINHKAVKKHLLDTGKSVVVLCAGWKGHFSLEDTLYAGALVYDLKDQFEFELDSTLAAYHIYKRMRPKLMVAIENSSHYNRLQKLGIQKDIEFAMKFDKCSVLPVYKNGSITDH